MKADRATAKSLLEAIVRHMVPETNPRYERAMFNLNWQLRAFLLEM